LDSELRLVLQKVGLETLSDDNGLDAWLGSGGRQLSGGEKRRIGIARALLHDAPILLLDEPTEGLDKQTERQIMSLFNEHFSGKTVIFITHRLVDLDKMDLICLLEQGEIVESGPHEQLVKAKGRYCELLQTL
jgi:ATP-binding cassette subfamily C protein CydC